MSYITHPRKNIRLPYYNYASEGIYFITICTRHREPFFGNITDQRLILNDAGKILKETWLDIPNRFPFVSIHDFIIMPNHFHAIIETDHTTSIRLGDIVGAFKSITTNQYINGIRHKNWKPFEKRLWQRNYYEHIIRSEKSYQTLSQYIQNNPLSWKEDIFYI
ncbi:REP-associated tyrosine transposase [Sulfurovum sp. ST-21]|uniref:Transposase n=1 Tax=Sulfurovum indicum TaxID=2779528 RepID=A0A7M1S1E9_9BACT|nr:transposase [Sulfurovum indicum]QOR61064.1 transposase [Sulfurovum indicum]